MTMSSITRYSIITLLLFIVATVSCTKVDRMILNKGETPLAISASRDEVVLEEKNFQSEAVAFNWTTGSNRGTDQSISYTFIMDIASGGNSDPVVHQLGKAVTSINFNVQELFGLLIERWNVQPGQSADIRTKVLISLGTNPAYVDSTDWLTVKVHTYIPVTKTLYLLGDAAPNGWSADNATEMNADPNIPGKFTWRGTLSAGELKFITTPGEFVPSYNRGSSNTRLVYRDSFDQPDDKFVIDEGGLYEITIDLLNLSISIVKSSDPAYSRLWIIGDAIPTGWNIDNPAEMRVDESNKFIFTYNEILSAGEFKIPVSTGDFNTDYYMPLVNHQDISETGVQLVPGGNPDYKWQITEPGPYKIKLNIQIPSIEIKKFVPYEKIYMVGDATPVGWNIDNPYELTRNPNNIYEFWYEGHMSAGEFKFPVETGDWGGDFFMPVFPYQDLDKTEMKFVPGGQPDNKWRITEPGNYRIVINQLYETISITKL